MVVCKPSLPGARRRVSSSSSMVTGFQATFQVESPPVSVFREKRCQSCCGPCGKMRMIGGSGCLYARAEPAVALMIPELIIIHFNRTPPPPPHRAHKIPSSNGNEATVPCLVPHLLAARRPMPVKPATKMVSGDMPLADGHLVTLKV